MTNKERVMAALNFQQPDYIPLYMSFWPEFTAMWEEAHPDEGVSIADYYDVAVKVVVGDETPYMTKACTLRRQKGADYEVRRDGWGRTIRVHSDAYFMQQIDNAYDAAGNLKYGEFDPPDLPERYARLDGVKTGGPFIRTYFMTGETELLTNMAGDPELAAEQVMRTAKHLTAIGLEQLHRWKLYDTGMWISDDMASTAGPMFGPKTAEKIMAPAWSYMCDTFKAAGASKVIIDSDGNVGPLLDLFIDIGFDAIYPVEYKAGLDCLDLRRKYGDKLAFFGGLSNGLILPRGNPKEIVDHTLRIMAAGREGGLVMGTHSIGPDISLDSWDLCFDTICRHRSYPLQLPG
jgi:uroporphyrinogen-III decarboxylase